ncbi:hypothetical protein A8C32_07800 [Flavivirga aquatica]|uniref:histidine kinase n=1 Tax=Flavivirga aquatica TaxID=1849968 RepID=A0A1E5SIY0_9FLAO|nr:ATP-binding protein [Flavivirga aquatica]OEJ99070.1 hypothetical protein A8C32_07800 [Flavivirga aquatica]
MKFFYYSLIAILGFAFPTYCQQKPNISLDSIYLEIDRAFNLNQINKYGEAIEVGTKVLEYSNRIDDDYLKAKAYNVLGNAHFYANNNSLSFDYLFKAKDLFVKIKDTAKIIVVYNNIGENYRAVDSVKESDLFFKKSLELAESTSPRKELIYPLFNIGLNLMYHFRDKDNDYVKSLEYLKRGEEIAEKFKIRESIVGEVFEALSFVYNKLGYQEESIAYYNKTVEFTKKHNYLDVLAEAHYARAYINEEKNDFENAYRTLEKYIDTYDSLYSLQEYEAAKQIEADNFLRENEIKLKLIEKEKAIQDSIIAKSRIFNIALVLFIVMLLLFAFWIHKKNQQLKLAKDKAENLSKVKSDFYSEISHELRTPLYAVIELSGLLLKENVNAKHKEYLESLKFSGNHLMSLINNVLELNRVESGKMKLQLLDFDLKNLISNIIDSLEYALRDSNNTISLKYDNSIPNLLVGDSLKLSQVLINLISNAIKFTNDGHVDVIINKVEELDEDVKVYFKVSDNGLGISTEKQTQIFEDFYQEHAKNSKSYKGTGLGLSIVKRMLVAMNSDINVISKEDEGSTFLFELVFQKSNKANLEIEVYENQLQYIQDCTILIVDDNKINQLVTRKVLDQLDIKSKTVDCGIKAIEAVKREHFDCILMDLHMPEIDGYETTKRIREFNTNIPIIALTAASSEEVEAKIHGCDMDGYILKPFINAEFVEIINKVMQKVNESVV